MLGLERVGRGEGEITATMRLLKEFYRRHNRYTDIITLDSLYAKAPIINEIIDQNMIAVIRVKQQHPISCVSSYQVIVHRWNNPKVSNTVYQVTEKITQHCVSLYKLMQRVDN